MLKTYVVASEIHPRLVGIFFRDRLLTDASFRTKVPYRDFIEGLMHKDEPVITLLLGDSYLENERGLEHLVTRLFPWNGRRRLPQEQIEHFIFWAVGTTTLGAESVECRVNETFDLAHLRPEMLTESAALGAEEAVAFVPDPKRNFLPHIVETAARAGIPLCFIRVKRHPGPDGHVGQSEDLRRYIADLRAWLESRGCAFIDMTDDPDLTAEMYLRDEYFRDDHIAPWGKRRATEVYAQKLRPLLHP